MSILAATPWPHRRPGCPIGGAQVLVHGLDDSTVPPELSRGYARAARAAGDDDVALVEIPGLDHMAITDPGAASWEPIAARLAGLVDRAGGSGG